MLLLYVCGPAQSWAAGLVIAYGVSLEPEQSWPQ